VSGERVRLEQVSDGQVARASHLNQYYDLFQGGHVHDVIAAYGARGDGTADDAPAVQAAIDAAVRAGGGTVALQTGTYAIASTLRLVEASGVRIQGLGATGQTGRTVLRWNGAAGGTALFVDRTRDSVIEGLSIVDGARPFGVGIDADQTARDPITSNLTFRELAIEGGTVAGIRLANSNMGNNDLHKFDNVQCIGGGPAGLLINNVNSKGHLLWGGTFSHKTHGIRQVNGSFHCFGTNFETNQTDVYLSNVTDTIGIYAIQSENSQRFLETLHASPAWAVVVAGSRIEAGHAHPDGNFVVWRFGGPLTFLNNDFATANHVARARFLIQGSGTPAMFNAVGNVFPNCDVFASVDFAVGHIIGNRYIDVGDVPRVMDDYWGPYGAAEVPNLQIGERVALGAGLVHSSRFEPSASAYRPDPNRGDYVVMTLGRDVRVDAPPGGLAGQELTFIWSQDGAGGRRVSYDAAYRTGGVAAIDTSAGTTTIDRFYCVDGTTWRLVSRVTGQ
jgi:hypothetical protein